MPYNPRSALIKILFIDYNKLFSVINTDQHKSSIQWVTVLKSLCDWFVVSSHCCCDAKHLVCA